jgi:hypothetical protein
LVTRLKILLFCDVLICIDCAKVCSQVQDARNALRFILSKYFFEKGIEVRIIVDNISEPSKSSVLVA